MRNVKLKEVEIVIGDGRVMKARPGLTVKRLPPPAPPEPDKTKDDLFDLDGHRWDRAQSEA